MGVRIFVITGGDPLKRLDIYDLINYATGRGSHTSLTPSAAPLLTREAIAGLEGRGLASLAVSLDGSTAEIHDAFRRVPDSYDYTLKAIRWTRELGLPVQINTTLTRRNVADLEGIVRGFHAPAGGIGGAFGRAGRVPTRTPATPPTQPPAMRCSPASVR